MIIWSKLQAGYRQAERENVLVSADRMIFRQPFNVRGIVKVAVTLDRDEARIVLLYTLEATSSGRGDMRLPVGSPHRSVRLDADEDSAIDDWHKVSERDEVEDSPRPRPVDARKEHIAVERLA